MVAVCVKDGSGDFAWQRVAGGGTTVNVLDYEMVADAFAAVHAAGGGTIYFPPGTYTPPSNSATVPYTRVYGWAITASNIHVDLAPGALIDGTALGNLAAAIEVQGTRTADVATVTADIVAGANTITVASSAGLAVGDTIVIRSSGEEYATERNTGTPYYVKAEHATISGIVGTTVTLTGPVLLDYDATATYTVTVDVLDMPEHISIRGGRIRMNTTNRHFGVRAFYARDVTVSTVIEQADEMGIEFYGCRDVTADRCTTDNIIRSNLGYGVRFTGCDNGRALHITGRSTRHLIDAEGAVSNLPVSTFLLYDACTAFDGTGGAFSTHAGCHTVTMRDCEAVRCNGFFLVRSRHTRLINPTGRGMRYTAGEGNPHGLTVGEDGDGTGNAGEYLHVTGMDFDCTYDSTVSVSAHGIFADAPLVNAVIQGHIRGYRTHGAQMRGLTMRDTDLDLVLDGSNQDGVDGDFLYGLLIAPYTAANGNNQKGVRIRVEAVNPKRNALRLEGNSTNADPSERIEITAITRDFTASQPVIHLYTGYFREVFVRGGVSPTATGMTSGGQLFIGYTGANHATGPYLQNNLVGTTFYVQGTTAY